MMTTRIYGRRVQDEFSFGHATGAAEQEFWADSSTQHGAALSPFKLRSRLEILSDPRAGDSYRCNEEHSEQGEAVILAVRATPACGQMATDAPLRRELGK